MELSKSELINQLKNKLLHVKTILQINRETKQIAEQECSLQKLKQRNMQLESLLEILTEEDNNS